MTKLYSPSLALALVASTLVSTVACEGRDPLVSQRNDDAIIEPPPPPPPPEVRTLGSKRLFGTMPIENRFDDPLMTGSGSSWIGYSNDFQSYAVPVREVSASPTQTPFLKYSAENNPRGALITSQVKTATTPLHIEIWAGRDADNASFDSMDIALTGLFVGEGEQAVQLAPDEASRVDVAGRTWMKYSADIEEGPIGWSTFIASDNVNGTTFYLGGPVAVDLDLAAPNTALRLAAKRAMTDVEKLVVAETVARNRNLAKRPDVRPAALPGVPPRL